MKHFPQIVEKIFVFLSIMLIAFSAKASIPTVQVCFNQVPVNDPNPNHLYSCVLTSCILTITNAGNSNHFLFQTSGIYGTSINTPVGALPSYLDSYINSGTSLEIITHATASIPTTFSIIIPINVTDCACLQQPPNNLQPVNFSISTAFPITLNPCAGLAYTGANPFVMAMTLIRPNVVFETISGSLNYNTINPLTEISKNCPGTRFYKIHATSGIENIFRLDIDAETDIDITEIHAVNESNGLSLTGNLLLTSAANIQTPIFGVNGTTEITFNGGLIQQIALDANTHDIPAGADQFLNGEANEYILIREDFIVNNCDYNPDYLNAINKTRYVVWMGCGTSPACHDQPAGFLNVMSRAQNHEPIVTYSFIGNPNFPISPCDPAEKFDLKVRVINPAVILNSYSERSTIQIVSLTIPFNLNYFKHGDITIDNVTYAAALNTIDITPQGGNSYLQILGDQIPNGTHTTNHFGGCILDAPVGYPFLAEGQTTEIVIKDVRFMCNGNAGELQNNPDPISQNLSFSTNTNSRLYFQTMCSIPIDGSMNNVNPDFHNFTPPYIFNNNYSSWIFPHPSPVTDLDVGANTIVPLQVDFIPLSDPVISPWDISDVDAAPATVTHIFNCPDVNYYAAIIVPDALVLSGNITVEDNLANSYNYLIGSLDVTAQPNMPIAGFTTYLIDFDTPTGINGLLNGPAVQIHFNISATPCNGGGTSNASVHMEIRARCSNCVADLATTCYRLLGEANYEFYIHCTGSCCTFPVTECFYVGINNPFLFERSTYGWIDANHFLTDPCQLNANDNYNENTNSNGSATPAAWYRDRVYERDHIHAVANGNLSNLHDLITIGAWPGYSPSQWRFQFELTYATPSGGTTTNDNIFKFRSGVFTFTETTGAIQPFELWSSDFPFGEAYQPDPNGNLRMTIRISPQTMVHGLTHNLYDHFFYNMAAINAGNLTFNVTFSGDFEVEDTHNPALLPTYYTIDQVRAQFTIGAGPGLYGQNLPPIFPTNFSTTCCDTWGDETTFLKLKTVPVLNGVVNGSTNQNFPIDIPFESECMLRYYQMQDVIGGYPGIDDFMNYNTNPVPPNANEFRPYFYAPAIDNNSISNQNTTVDLGIPYDVDEPFNLAPVNGTDQPVKSIIQNGPGIADYTYTDLPLNTFYSYPGGNNQVTIITPNNSPIIPPMEKGEFNRTGIEIDFMRTCAQSAPTLYQPVMRINGDDIPNNSIGNHLNFRDIAYSIPAHHGVTGTACVSNLASSITTTIHSPQSNALILDCTTFPGWTGNSYTNQLAVNFNLAHNWFNGSQVDYVWFYIDCPGVNLPGASFIPAFTPQQILQYGITEVNGLYKLSNLGNGPGNSGVELQFPINIDLGNCGTLPDVPIVIHYGSSCNLDDWSSMQMDPGNYCAPDPDPNHWTTCGENTQTLLIHPYNQLTNNAQISLNDPSLGAPQIIFVDNGNCHQLYYHMFLDVTTAGGIVSNPILYLASAPGLQYNAAASEIILHDASGPHQYSGFTNFANYPMLGSTASTGYSSYWDIRDIAGFPSTTPYLLHNNPFEYLEFMLAYDVCPDATPIITSSTAFAVVLGPCEEEIGSKDWHLSGGIAIPQNACTLQNCKELAATLKITDASCDGFADGVINVQITDGLITPYSYILTDNMGNIILQGGGITTNPFDIIAVPSSATPYTLHIMNGTGTQLVPPIGNIMIGSQNLCCVPDEQQYPQYTSIGGQNAPFYMSDLIAQYPTYFTSFWPLTFSTQNVIVFNGTLIVDVNCNIQGCPSILCAPNFEIYINSGVILTIEGSSLSACTDMWRGIYVHTQNSKVKIINGTTISDAVYAVDCGDKGNYEIDRSTFNNNYIGLWLQPDNGFPHYDYSASTVWRTSFTNTGLLLPPHSTEYSLAGILAFDGTGIFVGDASLGNIFSKLRSGIIANESDIVSTENRFINIHPQLSYQFEGCGIYSGIGFLGYGTGLSVTGTNSQLTGSADFDNCSIGISANELKTLYVADNWFDKTNFCVKAKSFYHGDIKVDYNRMDRHNYGIFFYNQYTKQEAVKNIINTNIPGYSNGGPTDFYGVRVTDYPGAYTQTWVNANTISNGRYGVMIENTGKTSVVSDNDINFTSNVALQQTTIGIKATNCSYSKITYNSVTGIFGGHLNFKIGIQLNTSPSMLVWCNGTRRLTTGFDIRGNCDFTDFRGNEMGDGTSNYHLGTGLVVRSIMNGTTIVQNGVIGNQGDGGNTSRGNLFYGPFTSLVNGSSNWDAVTYNIPFTFNPGVFLTMNSDPYDLVQSTQYPNYPLLFNKLFPFAIATSKYFCPEIISYPDDHTHIEDRGEDSSLMEMLADTSSYGGGEVPKWIEQRKLFNRMSMDSIFRTSNSLYANFYDTAWFSSVGLNERFANELEKHSDSSYTDFSRVIEINDSIPTVTSYNSTEKTMNEFVINKVTGNTFGMSATDSLMVEQLAYSCPWQYGLSVYKARALYSLWNDTAVIEDEVVCDENFRLENELSEVEQEQHEELLVYPNPNDGQFYIGLPEGGEFILRITDAFGRTVLEKKYNTFASITEQNLTTGMYFYHLQNGNKTYTGKIVIMKP